MTKKEAAMLLELIRLSYPSAYRDMDDRWKVATINMWASSFPEVPYDIVEQAFNHYRMGSKYPPTVAEMVEELRHIHYQAVELANIQRMLGNQQMLEQYRSVAKCTERYTDARNLGGLNIAALQGRIGGGNDGSGASGDRLDRADRLSLL